MKSKLALLALLGLGLLNINYIVPTAEAYSVTKFGNFNESQFNQFLLDSGKHQYAKIAIGSSMHPYNTPPEKQQEQLKFFSILEYRLNTLKSTIPAEYKKSFDYTTASFIAIPESTRTFSEMNNGKKVDYLEGYFTIAPKDINLFSPFVEKQVIVKPGEVLYAGNFKYGYLITARGYGYYEGPEVIDKKTGLAVNNAFESALNAVAKEAVAKHKIPRKEVEAFKTYVRQHKPVGGIYDVLGFGVDAKMNLGVVFTADGGYHTVKDIDEINAMYLVHEVKQASNQSPDITDYLKVTRK